MTGDKPFDGDNVTDVLAAVVRAEPDWATLDRRAPAHVRALVRKCLRKDARQRLRDIGDARVALEDGPPSRREIRPRRNLVPFALGLSALGLAAGLVLGGILRPHDLNRSAKSATRFTIEIPEGQRLSGDGGVAISRDGTQIAYPVRLDEGRSLLSVRSLDRLEAQTLVGTEGAYNPFFSPDGQWIGFATGQELRKVPTTSGGPGGLVQTLCSVRSVFGASWERDGTIYFAQYGPPDGSKIFRVPASGGTPEALSFSDMPAAPIWGELFPGGRAFLMAQYEGSPPEAFA